jgi:hypothetical protein
VNLFIWQTFARHITHKGLIWKTHKELYQKSCVKINNPRENDQRIDTIDA